MIAFFSPDFYHYIFSTQLYQGRKNLRYCVPWRYDLENHTDFYNDNLYAMEVHKSVPSSVHSSDWCTLTLPLTIAARVESLRPSFPPPTGQQMQSKQIFSLYHFLQAVLLSGGMTILNFKLRYCTFCLSEVPMYFLLSSSVFPSLASPLCFFV